MQSNSNANPNLNTSPAAPGIGLSNKSNGEMLTLRFIDASIDIIDDFARVSLTHHYLNLTDKIIDTEFNFPKTTNSIFDSIAAVYDDDTIIVGIIEEKNKAQALHIESVSKGDTVVYAEIGNKMNTDMMTTSIGNLLPNQSVKIKFSYLEKLDISVNKYYKFILPSTLTPKYVPHTATMQIIKDFIVTGNLEELNENLHEINKNRNLTFLPLNKCDLSEGFVYPWNINVSISSSKRVQNVKVTSNHDVNTTCNDLHTQNSQTEFKISLAANKIHFPNKDFVLKFETHDEDILGPKLLLTKHPRFQDDYALYFSFNPLYQYKKLFLNNTTEDENISGMMDNFKGCFMFVLDRSGSMSGGRIETAISALLYFLKSLPEGSTFNILSFGSGYEYMFDQPVEANDKFINLAITESSTFDSNLGGTELSAALKNLKEIIINSYLKSKIPMDSWPSTRFRCYSRYYF